MKKKISVIFFIVVITIIPSFFSFGLIPYIELVLASIVIRGIVSLCTPKTYNETLSFFLIIAQCFYTFFILIMFSFASDGNYEVDILKLVGDSQNYFSNALRMVEVKNESFLNYSEYSTENYFFFQYLLSRIMLFFNAKYLAGLLFVMLVGLLNLNLLFRIAILLNFKEKTIKYLGWFYIFLPHIFASNVKLYKDVLIVFAFLLLVYALLNFKKHRNLIQLLLLIPFSLFICFFIRLPFIVLFLMTIYFMIYNKKTKFLNLFVSLVFLVLITSLGKLNFMKTNLGENFDISSTYYNHQEHITENSEMYGSGIVTTLVGNYSSSPIHIKLIKLPLVVIVQYFTPINFLTFEHLSPWSYIDINMKVLWVLFFGPLIIFSSMNIKYFNDSVKKMMIIGLLGYVIVAFMQTGIVPRYAIMFINILIIPISFMYYKINIESVFKIKFQNFMRLYFLIFTVLVIGYSFLKFF